MRRLGVLLSLLLIGCGDGGGEPIRLIEAGDRARVSWPERRLPELPRRLARARIGSMARPGRLVDLAMWPAGARHRESRVSLLAPPRSVYTFALKLPARPRLETGLGFLSQPATAGRKITFRIRLEAEGEEPVVLLTRTVRVSKKAGWRQVTVDLAPWAGRSVELSLETSAATKKPTIWAGWGAPEILSGRQRRGGYDVLLIALDTLRADHLGSYGYHRPTSPNLDALAAEGVLFDQAISQAPWTRPSFKSMLSGVYPQRRDLHRKPLAWTLWHHGYRTAALTGGGQLAARLGFHTGFEVYRVHDWVEDPSSVVDWLEAGRHRRDFLFLHTYEIHDPYTHKELVGDLPPGRIRDRFAKHEWVKLGRDLTADEKAYVEAMYDSGIAFTDRRLGELFGRLEDLDLLDDTLLVVTSDHGEEFWEHGDWNHGGNLYDHQVRVPLILRLPDRLRRELPAVRRGGGTVIRQQVRLVDLVPTILDLLGVPQPAPTHGRSLRPLLASEAMPDVAALSENTNAEVFQRRSLRSRRFKFVHSFPRGGERSERYELYDLLRDPLEQDDLADERRELVDRLREQLDALAESDDAPDEGLPDDLDPALRRELEALGYVGN